MVQQKLVKYKNRKEELLEIRGKYFDELINKLKINDNKKKEYIRNFKINVANIDKEIEKINRHKRVGDKENETNKTSS